MCVYFEVVYICSDRKTSEGLDCTDAVVWRGIWANNGAPRGTPFNTLTIFIVQRHEFFFLRNVHGEMGWIGDVYKLFSLFLFFSLFCFTNFSRILYICIEYTGRCCGGGAQFGISLSEGNTEYTYVS